MSQKSRLIKNVLSNYVTQLIYGVSNFVLVGYVVRKLGTESCGLVALLMSTIVIASLLERGITRALVKYVAEEAEKPGRPMLSKYVSTSFAWYLIAGLLGGGMMVGLAHVSDRVFEIPLHLEADARIGWYLMGLRIAITFPFNVFQGVLHGHQRYDLVNVARNVAIVLRLFGTIVFFELFYASIPALLWIAIGSFLVERIMWVVFSYRITGGIHLNSAQISGKIFGTLLGFGTFVLINNIGNMLGYEAVKYVVGSELSITDVGAYTLIATIAVFSGMLVSSISSVLTPAASRLNALDQKEKQVRLISLSTKYAVILSGVVCIVPIFFIDPLLRIWVGDGYPIEYLSNLTFAGAILLIGQWFAGTSICLLQIVTGVGRVKGLAIITISWASCGLALSWAYVHFLNKSLLMVVIIITVARIIGAIANFIYGLRVFDISIISVLKESVARPLIVALSICALSFFLAKKLNLFDLTNLIWAGFTLFFTYFLLTWSLVLSRIEKTDLLSQLAKVKPAP